MEFKELSTENLERAATMLKAIAHPLRLSIVGTLEDGKKVRYFKSNNEVVDI